MADKKLLFLTGRLAEPRLAETVAAMGLPNGSWRIANLGIKVAALMTENIVRNRLKEPLEADRVIVPGRSRMNLGHLAEHYGVPFERGPDEIIDLPQFFGHDGKPPDLSKQDIRIFAEIVDAPGFTVEQLVARGRELIAKGGDVIDIGCQPDVPFPAPRGDRRGAEARRLQGQRRFRQRRRAAPRRPRRRRLRAQPR